MGSEKAKMALNKAQQRRIYSHREHTPSSQQTLIHSRVLEADSLRMFQEFEAVEEARIKAERDAEAARIKAEKDGQEEFMNDLRAL